MHHSQVALLSLSFIPFALSQDLFLATGDRDQEVERLQPPVAPADPVPVSVDVQPSGVYTLKVRGRPWYSSSSAPVVCVAGKQVPLTFKGSKALSGTDKFGSWMGIVAKYRADDPPASMEITFKHYVSQPELVVGTASFPEGLDTANCGSNEDLSTHFPAFNTTAEKASTLNTLSWRGGTISTTAAAKGLDKLGANGLDCGPVVSTDSSSQTFTSLVWSTLDNHKIVPQLTRNGIYSMGVAAAIPKIPKDYSYSVVFFASTGGATAAMYAWGGLLQEYYDISYSKRLPSITLTDIGYYTDDGAYYYVWGGGKEKNDTQLSSWIPPRPWPAEEGLVLVKEALYAQGVPIAYMQLDDWWYQGPFYFGNVKSVVDWHASKSSGLFPHDLPAFSDKLNLPLQLYTPFWSDRFQTKYRTFESTQFKGTKLVVPDDSYHFFSDLFDLGKSMTHGRFSTYEIDFLDANFKGCAACFADVGAADRWYEGMATAAQERNITIQYCLPSATDMLAALSYPSVVQARASGDYARPEGNMEPWGNTVTLGGASLLLGATAMAPSKDTLWTASPQPPTSSDRTHSGYMTQPHVELDVILATLSLGPVGISDGLHQTDVALVGQAFRNSKDSTLLRPSRPLSTVDAVFANTSQISSDIRAVWRRLDQAEDDFNAPSFHAADVGRATKEGRVADIRATHASLGKDKGPNSHYIVAWMTTHEVTLQATDLYPAPAASIRLALRKHIIKPAGPAQYAGCVDNMPAVPSCIELLPKGEMPRLPPVATKTNDITAYGYWSVYEPSSNNAYFLGELSKIVHVSPQRFTHILTKGDGPCGLTVGVIGTPDEAINLVAVDPRGIVHVVAVKVPSNGAVDVVI